MNPGKIEDRSIKPLISVLIPAYNCAQYLAATIESVLAQSCADFELIVVDNNSADETLAVVSRYSDPRLYYVKYKETVPMGENWDRCLSLAAGKYVCLLHADDQFQPRCLEVESQIMEADPAIGYVYSAVNFIDEKQAVLQRHSPFPESYVRPGREEFRQSILGNYVFCPSVMVRRECYSRVGGFKPGLKCALDWDMWLRLDLASGKVGYSAELLAAYRVHAGSFSASSSIIGTPAASEEWYQVIRDNLTSPDFLGAYPKSQAREITDKALLRYFLRCLKLIFKTYWPRGEKANLWRTVRFLLSDKLWGRDFRLSWRSVLLAPQLMMSRSRGGDNRIRPIPS
jgi:glycosyltransferase involved in cell wall biosynthesis